MFRQAFNAWSEVVPLDFNDITGTDQKADIKIGFVSGEHGDYSPFDGKGMQALLIYDFRRDPGSRFLPPVWPNSL